jgi:23S rRNA pseudouridine1911/1915/1917 synthase
LNKNIEQITIDDIPIIYEDNDIIVINKPSGITVHEAPGEKSLTINEIFQSRFLDNISGRDMIVHRLDKGTSGVMILAKTDKSRVDLQRQFADREVKKTYLTLIKGHLDQDKGTIRIPLGRDQMSREKISPQKDGKNAITDFVVIKKHPKYSLVEANPKTGRTHQIRTHFASIGHPIFGDKKYGNPKDNIDRIFLHASKISFSHPENKNILTFRVELPEDLKTIIDTL